MNINKCQKLKTNIVDGWIRNWITQIQKTEDMPRNELDKLKYVMNSGRRTRPLLLLQLLSESDFKKFQKSVRNICICIEITHRTSLIVDDMVDKENMRKGALTYPSKYGYDDANVMAHSIMALASMSILEEAYDIRSCFLKAYRSMCIAQRYDLGLITLEPGELMYQYNNLVVKKTSSLFKFVFECAAQIKKTDVDRWGEIGELFGKSYQMSNDYHDDLCEFERTNSSEEKYQYSVTLISALLSDTGSVLNRRLITNAIKTSANKNDHNKIQKLYRERNIISRAENIMKKNIEDLELSLEKLNCPNITRIIKSNLDMIDHMKWWSHV